MGKVSALIFASATVLASHAAFAADLPPPMADTPLRGTVLPDVSGFYLRGDVGVGIEQSSSHKSTFSMPVPGFQYDHASVGDSATISIGAGYQFNDWFRADITADYHSKANYNAVASYNGAAFVPNPCGGTGRCPDVYTGNVSSYSFLANGYLDVGTWYGVTPYIGAGVGAANLKTDSFTDRAIGNTGGGYASGTSKTNFAWAAMAGLSYSVTPNLKLDIGYRYLNMGRANSGAIICQPAGVVCNAEVQSFRVASHDIRIGMRWLLNDTPAPAYVPEAPLVRKY